MSKPVPMGVLLRPRISVGSSETLAVQIASCPGCRETIRLMWPTSVMQIPSHRLIYLDCPLCRNSFHLLAGDLVAVCEGGEQYAAAEVRHL